MHLRRWLLTLVITLMLIDSWVKRAEATSIEPNRGGLETPCLAQPCDGAPTDSR
jgi:hypothetical protein